MLTAKGGARVVTAVLALAVAVVGLLALVGSRSAGPAGASGRTVASAPAPNRAVAPAVTKLSAGDEPGPDEVLAGVYISNIQSVNLTTNSFDADFYVWLRWRNPDLDPTAGVEVMNPYMAWGLVVTPVYDQPQRQSDGSLLWLCRYQGSFNAPLSLSDYPFERQNLRIIIEDGIGTAQRSSTDLTQIPSKSTQRSPCPVTTSACPRSCSGNSPTSRPSVRSRTPGRAGPTRGLQSTSHCPRRLRPASSKRSSRSSSS